MWYFARFGTISTVKNTHRGLIPSEEIEAKQFVSICLILQAKFGNDPLFHKFKGNFP